MSRVRLGIYRTAYGVLEPTFGPDEITAVEFRGAVRINVVDRGIPISTPSQTSSAIPISTAE